MPDILKGTINDAEAAGEKLVTDALAELKTTVNQILDLVSTGYKITITLEKK